MRLREARKVVAEAQRFKQATGGKFPDLSSMLDWLVGTGTYLLHFTPKEKVGVNPKSKWKSVPAGVYTYPLTPTSLRDLRAGTNEEVSKYATNFPNLFVLAPSRGNTVTLNANGTSPNYGAADYLRSKKALRLTPKAAAWAAGMEKEHHLPFERIWRLTFYLAADGYIPDTTYTWSRWPMIRNVGGWNKLLRQAGVHTIIDMGSGTIDHREKTQALMLDTAGIRVVASGPNPVGGVPMLHAAYSFWLAVGKAVGAPAGVFKLKPKRYGTKVSAYSYGFDWRLPLTSTQKAFVRDFNIDPADAPGVHLDGHLKVHPGGHVNISLGVYTHEVSWIRKRTDWKGDKHPGKMSYGARTGTAWNFNVKPNADLREARKRLRAEIPNVVKAIRRAMDAHNQVDAKLEAERDEAARDEPSKW